MNSIPNSQDTPEMAALTAQLRELNERIRFYLTRLWQLPFAYLGISAIGIIQVLGQSNSHWSVAIPAGLLAVAGGFVMWWCRAHFQRSSKLKDSIERIEVLLRLPKSTDEQRMGAVVGVYSLCALGMPICALGVIVVFLRGTGVLP